MLNGLRAKVHAKLARLDEYLTILARLRKMRKDILLKDPLAYGALERYLHLAIESMLDIGKLILTSLEARTPENNHEIFELLQEKKVISKALFKKLHGISGFRSILVHDYMRIDRNMVYRNLMNGLSDLRAFQRAIAKFLLKCV